MNLAVTGQEAWEWFRGAPLKILITLVAAVIVRALLVRAIGGFVGVTLLGGLGMGLANRLVGVLALDVVV